MAKKKKHVLTIDEVADSAAVEEWMKSVHSSLKNAMHKIIEKHELDRLFGDTEFHVVFLSSVRPNDDLAFGNVNKSVLIRYMKRVIKKYADKGIRN